MRSKASDEGDAWRPWTRFQTSGRSRRSRRRRRARPIGLRALARLDQASHAHVFGSIARQAPIEAVRQAALARAHERADVLAVAINSEFKDVAVAAVDRLAERDDLEQVAARAKNKGAAKRASAVLRERDERAAREAALTAAAEVQVMSVEMPVETVAETIISEQDLEAARLRAEQEAEAARVADQERQRELALAAERARAAAEADRVAEQAAAEQKAQADAEAAREAERRRQASDAEARERRDGLNRLNQLLGRAEALAQKPDLSLKTAARALRDVKAALADVPPLPSRHDYEEAVHRLKAAQAALTPKVQDLREVAEWQQWANIGNPGTALREDGSAANGRRCGSGRAPDPRAPGAVAAGRRRPAAAGRGAVAPVQGRARRAVGAVRGAFRPPRRASASRTWRRK
jgi:hypothetical protein